MTSRKEKLTLVKYNQQIFIRQYKSPFGQLLIGDFQGSLCLLDWYYRSKRNEIDHRIQSYFQAEYVETETDLHSDVITQVVEYSKRKRKEFDLPISLAGSDFQQRVWQHLQKIPYGISISYQQLSKNMGNESAIRAVAAANGANAISIIIPCHRIIGKNGKLTGYAGGIQTKRKLLQLESALVQMEMDFN